METKNICKISAIFLLVFNIITFINTSKITYTEFVIINILATIWYIAQLILFISILKLKNRLTYLLPIYWTGEIYRIFYRTTLYHYFHKPQKFLYYFLMAPFYQGDLLFAIPHECISFLWKELFYSTWFLHHLIGLFISCILVIISTIDSIKVFKQRIHKQKRSAT